MNKDEIRTLIKNKRNAMTKTDVYNLSIIIQNKLITLLDNFSIDSFFIYKSFNNEVDTDLVIKHLINNDKHVFLPKIYKDSLLTIPYKNNNICRTNKFGILEPLGQPQQLNNFICILPLLATDAKGNRIGYGKGYYDKFLKNKQCIKIGICYDYQILNMIPTDFYDIPLDIIVSEKRILEIKHINKRE